MIAAFIAPPFPGVLTDRGSVQHPACSCHYAVWAGDGVGLGNSGCMSDRGDHPLWLAQSSD